MGESEWVVNAVADACQEMIKEAGEKADTLRLSGRRKERRVIVMRRPVKVNLALETKRKSAATGKKQEQTELHLIDENEPVKTWECAVLVCNTQFTLPQIGGYGGLKLLKNNNNPYQWHTATLWRFDHDKHENVRRRESCHSGGDKARIGFE